MPPVPAETLPVLRGAAALMFLAMLAGLAALVPVRGDLLGLMTGIGGSLAVALILPEPERRPALALGWSALAFALPVTLVTAGPGLPGGALMALAAVAGWGALCAACPPRG